MKTYPAFPFRLSSLVAVAVLSACASVPPTNPQLEQARADFRAAQSDAPTAERAALELKQAGDALSAADAALARDARTDEVNHLAYLTRQRVAIARETANRKTSELAVTEANTARDQVRLAARTQEANTSQQQAAASQRQADASQRDSAESQRQSAAAQQRADAASMQAQSAQQQADAAQARNAALEAQLRDLNAKQTSRGVVMTMGDVLFETNRSTLSSGGRRSIDKLSAFLAQNPQRTVLVEGFTDNVGSDAANDTLSTQRARAVQSALTDGGVNRDRVTIRGLGERHPVASNDDAAGRQQNRRFEIVLSDETGKIVPR